MPIPANCDNAENSFGQRGKGWGYPASVQGQYNYIHDLMQAVVDVPDQRGKGIFYWEPTWIAVPGNTGHPGGDEIYPRRVERG